MKQKINQYIDHTNLRPDATEADLLQLAQEARRYQFNSICIRSNWIERFSKLYRCSATIAFPEDFITESPRQIIGKSKVKFDEARKAILDGALELDPVMDLDSDIYNELCAYANLVQEMNSEIIIKPIFSCEILTEVEIKNCCKIISEVAVKYLQLKFCFKNSTGFIKIPGITLASPELIKFIADALNCYDLEQRVKIKAAGGVRNYQQALDIIDAAHGRLSHIGTSAGIEISSVSR